MASGVTISEMVRRFHKLNIMEASSRIIEDTSDELIALNQQQLYNKSVDKNDNKLPEYKDNNYALKKFQMNPGPGLGHPDGNLTGALYRGMYLKIDNSYFTIGSIDVKETQTENRWGKDIWGLTPESLAKYTKQTFYVRLKSYIEKTTGLAFGG